MKKLKLFSLILAILCFGTLLFACDYSNSSVKTLEISGNVYVNNEPLSKVLIKSNTKTYCETDENGYFSFTVNANKITLFAEKNGYTFSQNNKEVSSSINNLNFYATKIEKLNGGLSLKKVIITPTSIVAMGGEDFRYQSDKFSNQVCLKVKSLNISIDDSSASLGENELLCKNKNNEIEIPNTVNFDDIETGKEFTIKFSLDVYFKLSNNEHIFTEVNNVILKASSDKTTADLENNQIIYSSIGVNAKDAKFTYNISFVFNYYPYS